MDAVEILTVLVAAAWLGFGIWVWLHPKPLRKDPLFTPGIAVMVWMIQALFLVLFLLVLLVIRFL